MKQHGTEPEKKRNILVYKNTAPKKTQPYPMGKKKGSRKLNEELQRINIVRCRDDKS